MTLDTLPIYNEAVLLDAMQKLEPVSTFWQTLGFPKTYLSEDKTVRFSKVSERRTIAPLVLPFAAGQPINDDIETVSEFKPAYLKPKDNVEPGDVFVKRAGALELGGNKFKSPLARWNFAVRNIQRKHRNSIMRRWEWMAAQAMLYGRMTLVGEDYPEILIDFKRDPKNTIELGAGAQWGDSGVNVLDDLDRWISIVYDADWGGSVDKVIMGTSAWKIFAKSADLEKKLDRDFKQTQNMEFDLGVSSGAPVELKGRLRNGLLVYVYKDYYHLKGAKTMYMDPRDVLLVAPAETIGGVRCFGAIISKQAQFKSVPMYQRMWEEKGEFEATTILTQSAPIMVPENPDATLRARVVANI